MLFAVKYDVLLSPKTLKTPPKCLPSSVFIWSSEITQLLFYYFLTTIKSTIYTIKSINSLIFVPSFTKQQLFKERISN